MRQLHTGDCNIGRLLNTVNCATAAHCDCNIGRLLNTVNCATAAFSDCNIGRLLNTVNCATAAHGRLQHRTQQAVGFRLRQQITAPLKYLGDVMGSGSHFEGTGIIGLLCGGYRLPGRIHKNFQGSCETITTLC